VAILQSAFNAEIVHGLRAGAEAALKSMNIFEFSSYEVPGAFELPLAARVIARSGRFDAIVALGAVIRGETDHYEHIAREAAHGLARAAYDTEVPVGFGVLTVYEEAHARARADADERNKGGEAARAAVVQALFLAELRRSGRRSSARRRRS
jgi:6,7-dimethyl-8-ribityllumazine synthase